MKKPNLTLFLSLSTGTYSQGLQSPARSSKSLGEDGAFESVPDTEPNFQFYPAMYWTIKEQLPILKFDRSSPWGKELRPALHKDQG